MSAAAIGRDALIDAVAKAQFEHERDTHQIYVKEPWEQLSCTERDWFLPNARRAVDAVLPLIADAIMATRDGDAARDCATENAADLVRSFAAGDQP